MSFISFSTRFSRIVALIFFLSKVEIKSKPKLPLSSIAYPSFLSSTNNRARNKGKMDKKKAPRIPIRGAVLVFYLDYATIVFEGPQTVGDRKIIIVPNPSKADG